MLIVFKDLYFEESILFSINFISISNKFIFPSESYVDALYFFKELLKIFHRDTEEQEKRFVLLQEAYIRARYDKTYKITEEELLYLIEQVEKLKSVTEEICLAWINK